MKTIADMHDAELYGIRHDANAGTVQCVFHKEIGQDVLLLLSGITKFRCTDFGLQNVVFDLVSTVWQKIAIEDLRSYISWLFSTADGELLASTDELKLAVKDVLDSVVTRY